MTGPEIMAVIGFIAMVYGVVWAGWRYVEGRIEKAKVEATRQAEAAAALATMVQSQLSEHRLHVAETYVTKSGLREATEHIMEAIAGVRGSIDALGSRMDRVIEHGRSGGQR